MDAADGEAPDELMKAPLRHRDVWPPWHLHGGRLGYHRAAARCRDSSRAAGAGYRCEAMGGPAPTLVNDPKIDVRGRRGVSSSLSLRGFRG